MTSTELANLERTGKLKAEKFSPAEFGRLLRSGRSRLKDAENKANSLDSRFDLAYNAAHSLAVAALRYHGFRSDNRYLVFQVLELTLGIPAAQWRVLSKAHADRNLLEYEGFEVEDEQLVADVIKIAHIMERAVAALPLPEQTDDTRQE